MFLETSQLKCKACGRLWPVDHCLRLGESDELLSSDLDSKDFLRKIKEVVKRRFSSWYNILVKIISPVYYDPSGERSFLDHFDWSQSIVLNLGSGCSRLREEIINIDVTAYDTVDIQASIAKLPMSDETIDGVVTVAALEHVSDPQAVVQEIVRILKPGGKLYCYIPFMQGIHASPSDYQRYTPYGLKKLFEAMDCAKVKVTAGPASGFVWILQEFIAISLSFGIRPLFWFWYSVGFLLTPIKFLDIWLIRLPYAENIASGYSIICTKPSKEQD